MQCILQAKLKKNIPLFFEVHIPQLTYDALQRFYLSTFQYRVWLLAMLFW